ncbi:Lipoprotein [Enterobacter intestinihominis]
MKINPGLIGVVVIAGLSVALVKSCSDASSLQSDNDVLRSDNTLQGQVIATQAFNFNRFNQVTEHANRLNSLIDTSTEETIIKYREILRREKTCDLPVPTDVAGGLLEYAHRLRSSAMHTDTSRPDAADDRSAAASSMTYCQAVLWIKPLLAVIEKGNNNFAGIRQIELERKN